MVIEEIKINELDDKIRMCSKVVEKSEILEFFFRNEYGESKYWISGICSRNRVGSIV